MGAWIMPKSAGRQTKHNPYDIEAIEGLFWFIFHISGKNAFENGTHMS
jgi:hypothetical protein